MREPRRFISFAAVFVTAVAFALAGCSSGSGGEDQQAAVSSSAAVASTATPSEAADLAGASGIAQAMQAKIPTITKTVNLTEDTDPNDLLGRPHGYTSATILFDETVLSADDTDACDTTDPGVDCGATIEVFASAADAEQRAKYIDSVTSGLGGLFTEYDTVSGTALLRAAGAMKPSEAATYKKAFLEVAGQ